MSLRIKIPAANPQPTESMEVRIDKHPVSLLIVPAAAGETQAKAKQALPGF